MHFFVTPCGRTCKFPDHTQFQYRCQHVRQTDSQANRKSYNSIALGRHSSAMQQRRTMKNRRSILDLLTVGPKLTRPACGAAIDRYLLRARARPQQQTRRLQLLLSIDGTDGGRTSVPPNNSPRTSVLGGHMSGGRCPPSGRTDGPTDGHSTVL